MKEVKKELVEESKEEVKKDEQKVETSNSGTAFINNNQNGMGNIVSPQP